MSRVIKFRIWDSQFNVWVAPDDARMNCGTGEVYGKFSCGNVPAWILEQFTGLNDSEGKEIYEGDVSRNIHHDGWAVKCGYNNSQHRWSWYTIYNDNLYCHLGEGSATPEVIGNIHQNKEFLKGRES